jgi:molybdate transport system substrate-binding protein
MLVRKLSSITALVSAFIFCQAVSVRAVEINVLSSIGLKEVLNEVAPKFEAETGHKVKITYDVAAALKRRIEGGEAFDLTILTDTAIRDLIQQGRVTFGTQVNIARTGIGLAAKAGTPKIDIGTVDAFKSALRKASSIASSEEGWSGVAFNRILVRLGMLDEIKPKLKLVKRGYVAELVAKDEADLAVHLVSEILPVAGAQLVGPFPAEVQEYIVLTAGVGASAKEAPAASLLIRYLRQPEATSTVKSKGMEPG